MDRDIYSEVTRTAMIALVSARTSVSDSAELDVAEYFGDGRADGGLSNFVHRTAASLGLRGWVLNDAEGVLELGHVAEHGERAERHSRGKPPPTVE